MRSDSMFAPSGVRRVSALGRLLLVATAIVATTVETSAQAIRLLGAPVDHRATLRGGWMDAQSTARGLELLVSQPRPAGFFNPQEMGDFGFANSDMAFRDDLVFLGGFNGFQVYDISDPAQPRLRTTLVCPGGQGDLSVFGDLLFMSVEETRGRVDCGAQGVPDSVSPDRFRGVRIFDISNLDSPRQVAAVQTCRGSHTHTLVHDPEDRENLYVYVSGTSVARSAAELPGCSAGRPDQDPNTAYFRIEVIRVPLSAPQQARVVSEPRIFSDEQGNIAGLWRGGEHGPGTQRTSMTNQCHDITTYPEIGLAAGACAGNGILLDIRDPANPRRVEDVVDPNFAYWHSATFNNDASTVIFTDEWGGGMAARCRPTDRPEWGANAIFRRTPANELTLASYYKLPAPQTAAENCVAHNGSLIPVPGRDIKVQAWYQGGASVFDFTDPANPVEIAFFDRGPMADELVLGGYWSTYWYNGAIYGSEIGRGLDVLRLVPSEYLSQNEIDAARLVRMEQFNPQHQQKITWPASIVVARAYLDQLVRSGAVLRPRGAELMRELDIAEGLSGARQRSALARIATRLEREAAGNADAPRMRAMASVLRRVGS